MTTRTKSKNDNSKSTPDLLSTLSVRRDPGRLKKPAPTADQIADQIEAKIEETQGIADILRGKV